VIANFMFERAAQASRLLIRWAKMGLPVTPIDIA
jgi:hypothetical protein